MKILIASTPAPGHLNPLLTIARMAKARGDEVIVTTARAFEPTVRAAGMKFVPLEKGADFDLRSIDAEFPERENYPPGAERLTFDFLRVFIDTIPAQTRTIQKIVDSERPDIIIADSLFGGTSPIFMDKTKPRPPIVACGITFLWLDRPDGAPAGLGLPPAKNAREHEHYAEIKRGFDQIFTRPVQARANALLTEMGLPDLPASFTASRVLLADAYLQPSVPEFEYDFGATPATLHYVGALPPPPSAAPKPVWLDELDGSRKIVVVTQGTVANYDLGQLIEPTLQALADRDDLLVLATTGGRSADAIKIPLPNNARVAPFLPFDELLGRASVLVTNGGYGTVSLALQAGLPIVSAGLTEDKAEVSARVAWSGAGINLESNAPTSEAVRDAVTDILANNKFAVRASELSKALSQYDAKSRVLSVLDGLVTQRNPVAKAR
jgi:MGT family glycosyltransferase